MSSKTQAPVNATTKPSLNADQSGLLQRQCACGNSAGLTGQCATCQTEKLTLQRKQTAVQDKVSEVPPIAHEVLSLPRVPFIQSKLTIGASDDPLEREADRVADQVMAAPSHPAVSDAPPRIQRFTRQPTGQADMPVPASVDRVLSSPGRPLDPALQQDMGQRFGHDFSRVRVHTDAAAERSAREVNANAYTVRHDIVFGAGRFAPGTHEGRHLIAHELTHVVQQSGEQTLQMLQRKEENNAALAAIQGKWMYELLTELNNLPENILDDEEAGRLVGGPRLVIAMQAVKAKMQKQLVYFLTNNKRDLDALPPGQFNDITRFLFEPGERESQKTINTDLEVDITIVEPSRIRLPGEVETGVVLHDEGMVPSANPSSADAISDFETELLEDRRAITGVILDPDTREIIGYRTLQADGMSRLVDREGEFVVDVGTPLGVESEGLGPGDYLPTPGALGKGVAKAGAGIAGKVLVTGALKKGAVVGGKFTLRALNHLRRVSKALSAKGAKFALKKAAARAAGQTLPTVNKAINTELVHASEQAFKRGVFSSEKAAAEGLRNLSKLITEKGFPPGTILDTARADRVLVPFGKTGFAVYHVLKNGTAKLKTVLIARL